MSLFMLTWAITSLSLWAATYVFEGLQFNDSGALIISALVLGLANAIVRPLLILFTLPLTIFSLYWQAFGLLSLPVSLFQFSMPLLAHFLPLIALRLNVFKHKRKWKTLRHYPPLLLRYRTAQRRAWCVTKAP